MSKFRNYKRRLPYGPVAAHKQCLQYRHFKHRPTYREGKVWECISSGCLTSRHIKMLWISQIPDSQAMEGVLLVGIRITGLTVGILDLQMLLGMTYCILQIPKLHRKRAQRRLAQRYVYTVQTSRKEGICETISGCRRCNLQKHRQRRKSSSQL